MTPEQYERLARIEEGVSYLIKTTDRDREEFKVAITALSQRIDSIEPLVLENSFSTKFGRGVLWLGSLFGINFLIQLFK